MLQAFWTREAHVSHGYDRNSESITLFLRTQRFA